MPAKNVVTFKPGKLMEELVSQMPLVPDLDDDEDAVTVDAGLERQWPARPRRDLQTQARTRPQNPLKR